MYNNIDNNTNKMCYLKQLNHTTILINSGDNIDVHNILKFSIKQTNMEVQNAPLHKNKSHCQNVFVYICDPFISS